MCIQAPRQRYDMTKKLLSLPPNLVNCFHEIEGVSHDEYFCTSDPIGKKLGSGGGSAWLLEACRHAEGNTGTLQEWLPKEKRILLHAGGQSRRLPAYAPSGKILTPVPVFRWSRGQRISQNLLDLQLPLYERIMDAAPEGLHTLIASGDVYIRAGKLQNIPQADVVCYGMWVDASLAKNHGVFLSRRETPNQLDFMLQKPSVERLGQLMHSHLFLMDIGIWLLSDRAIIRLTEKCHREGHEISYYDLYSDFGCALGENPSRPDSLLSGLTTAILPLQDGEFYHYGTSREMLSSTLSIQNLVYDQRRIIHLGVKPHPSIFIQNADCKARLTEENGNTWIENSCVGEYWHLHGNNIITGVPRNDWALEVPKGVCIDMVPTDTPLPHAFALRPYGMNDAFRGDVTSPEVTYLGISVREWAMQRGLDMEEIQPQSDLQAARIFPISQDKEELGRLLNWMINDTDDAEARNLWRRLPKTSADELSDHANLIRLQRQREEYRKGNLAMLSANHRHSVFYQTNLDDMAHEFVRHKLPLPEVPREDVPLLTRISDQMFRHRVLTLRGEEDIQHEQMAFGLLREGLVSLARKEKQMPRMDVQSDQIVWGRSPVRIDLAGGWTDTPPYCLINGGNVVNIAIELNGQPPLQVYIKPSEKYEITLRSIDLGAEEHIADYEQLQRYAMVGSPFSIPKAALALAGFHPEFCSATFGTLREQLQDFGCGIELTLLSAIPAGSGLGTSSILAATVLGALSDFCGLHWDKCEISNRTLILEQLLTTGGGWQDQYGGVLPGVKLLMTGTGFAQTPEVRWLNDSLYTDPQYKGCHLLYYTGITRTAKKILAEIVRSMFLLDTHHMNLLAEMKEHALDVYEAFQQCNYERVGQLVRRTWHQNQMLDSGTNPECVRAITSLIDDLCTGYKLPGAGGGGYLYMMAKDPEAAARIKRILTENRPNAKARFVDMTLSKSGLQTSRS
ncbi:MAG: bifunctional fucokinase/fucose-1-phosphate guanylyltransferase [Bacteroidaceae bacterium]